MRTLVKLSAILLIVIAIALFCYFSIAVISADFTLNVTIYIIACLFLFVGFISLELLVLLAEQNLVDWKWLNELKKLI